MTRTDHAPPPIPVTTPNEPGPSPNAPRRPPRRVLVRPVVGVLLAGVVGGATWLVSTGTLRAGAEEAEKPQFATETVVRGDLEGSVTASGTLRYSGSRSAQTGTAGTVTALPTAGATVSPGDHLYSVNDNHVFLLPGDIPAWRDFTSGMDSGPDVQQLEQALSGMGFFAAEPDERFAWATVEAIMDWQQSHGLSRTGELPFGSIVFAAGDLRIGTVTANVGDHVSVGTELFQTSDTTQIVDVNLSLSDQQLAVLDTAVVVRLPGGAETSGRIISVGTPTETEGASGQQQTVIPIVIALADPAAASAFQEASVTVDIPSQRRQDVLSVPVSALLAITPDQFGVELVDPDGSTRRVPVETGLFAAGRVEISGDDVTEGARVVVPTR